MKRIVPSRIEGTILAPHSKSASQRAVVAAALAEGTSQLIAREPCADDLSTMRAVQALGARVVQKKGLIEVTGSISPKGGRIDCGESGLCMRLLTAVVALFEGEFHLLAEGSLSVRPMNMIAAPLASLGAKCTTTDGKPPIIIIGPMHAGDVTVDGSTSSQFLTGLLMALPLCKGDSSIAVHALKSKPYVELTLSVLKEFGINIDADENLESFKIHGKQSYRPSSYAVEGDWSGAAFLLAAGAIAGSVEVRGLNIDSTQADRRILDALQQCSANVVINPDSITVSRAHLRSFDFDATDCPDLFPPLVALAVNCEGTSTIKGTHRLVHKESDRAEAIRQEFKRIGCETEVDGDTMSIEGKRPSGGSASSRGDHRIAMALAVVALASSHGVEIDGDESVCKSYPHFFEDLILLGAGVS